MATFSAQEIQTGLQKLGELAQARGIEIHLIAVGGAVMVLAFGARRSTRDVDVFILAPPEARIVKELAARVADEFGWAPDWLNDGARAYLRGISDGLVIFNAPGIKVQAPSLTQLLAMKLSAWRARWIFRIRGEFCKRLGQTTLAMNFGRLLNPI